MKTIIGIVAAVVVNDAGHLLLVRKRGTTAFMQPGGKPEPGEAPIAALSRELLEELGCGIVTPVQSLGVSRAPAANEPECIVEADLYRVVLTGIPKPMEEIEELQWVDPENTGSMVLAPLTRDHVLPALRDRPAEKKG